MVSLSPLNDWGRRLSPKSLTFFAACGAALGLLWTVLIVLLAPPASHGQSGGLTVTTVAGSGDPGFADGAAAQARFSRPAGVAISFDGEVLVGDTGNARVRSVKDGQVTTLPTGAGAGFLAPAGLVDREVEQSVYVVDSSRHAVYLMNRKAGIPLSIAAGTGGTNPAGFVDGFTFQAKFNMPSGIAAGPASRTFPPPFFYVADKLNHRIRVIHNPLGKVSTLAGTGSVGTFDGPANQAQFNNPSGVAVGLNEEVIVADTGNHRIRVIANGQVTTLAGQASVAKVAAGFLDGPADQAQFSNPTSVAVGPNGEVYVADSGNHRIRSIRNGRVSTLAGSGTAGFGDGAAETAQFNNPTGIAVGSDGSVLVADTGNHRIRRIAAAGGVSQSAGQMVGGVADQAWTRSVRADTNGNGRPDAGDQPVYLSRSGNKIRIFSRVSPTFTNQATLEYSNPNPQSGRFQTVTFRQVSVPGGQLIAGSYTSRTTTISVSNLDRDNIGLDDNLNIAAVSITVERTDARKGKDAVLPPLTGSVSLNSKARNGVMDQVDLAQTGGKQASISLVSFDVNGDGKADYVSVPWTLYALTVGADSPRDPQVFIPLGPDGRQALDFDNDGVPDADLPQIAPVAGPPPESVEGEKVNFAQFGSGQVVSKDGQGISSTLILENPSESKTIRGTVKMFSSEGSPLTIKINGTTQNGSFPFSIPPKGVARYATDGSGDLVVGSLQLGSNFRVGGTLLFAGSGGVAGVGAVQPLRDFFVPIESDGPKGVQTGVAVSNSTGSAVPVTFRLRDEEGVSPASGLATATVAANGQLAKFPEELFAGRGINFSKFRGTLEVSAPVALNGMAIRVSPGFLSTLPVTASSPVNSNLNFAQFGNGRDIASTLILVNASLTDRAIGTARLFDKNGSALSVGINGSVQAGSFVFNIPPGGVRYFVTDGLGDTVVGSVQVSSSIPLGGAILFSAGFGVTGVGAVQPMAKALVPIESDSSEGVLTGVAASNSTPSPVPVTFRLRNRDGVTQGNSVSVTIPGNGQLAKFPEELFDGQGIDFSKFVGTLELTAPAPINAMAIRVSPGQFSTLPVTLVIVPCSPCGPGT